MLTENSFEEKMISEGKANDDVANIAEAHDLYLEEIFRGIDVNQDHLLCFEEFSAWFGSEQGSRFCKGVFVDPLVNRVSTWGPSKR